MPVFRCTGFIWLILCFRCGDTSKPRDNSSYLTAGTNAPLHQLNGQRVSQVALISTPNTSRRQPSTMDTNPLSHPAIHGTPPSVGEHPGEHSALRVNHQREARKQSFVQLTEYSIDGGGVSDKWKKYNDLKTNRINPFSSSELNNSTTDGKKSHREGCKAETKEGKEGILGPIINFRCWLGKRCLEQCKNKLSSTLSRKKCYFSLNLMLHKKYCSSD